MKTIIITPDGTASLQPSIDAARNRLRPPMIAPGAVTDAGYLEWRETMDHDCPTRSLAIAAIGARLLEMRGDRI